MEGIFWFLKLFIPFIPFIHIEIPYPTYPAAAKAANAWSTANMARFRGV